MNDCPNAEIRDLLPDWVAGALRGEARARVASHLAECAECRAEAELVASVRRAFAAGPAVDVGRVVAALPAPPGAVPVGRRRPAAPAWRSWRAAAVAAITVGATALVLAGDDAPPRTVAVAEPREAARPGPPDTPRVSAQGEERVVAFVDEDLTASEYDALVSELEADTELFAPLAEPVVEPVIGGTL